MYIKNADERLRDFIPNYVSSSEYYMSRYGHVFISGDYVFNVYSSTLYLFDLYTKNELKRVTLPDTTKYEYLSFDADEVGNLYCCRRYKNGTYTQVDGTVRDVYAVDFLSINNSLVFNTITSVIDDDFHHWTETTSGPKQYVYGVYSLKDSAIFYSRWLYGKYTPYTYKEINDGYNNANWGRFGGVLIRLWPDGTSKSCQSYTNPKFNTTYITDNNKTGATDSDIDISAFYSDIVVKDNFAYYFYESNINWTGPIGPDGTTSTTQVYTYGERDLVMCKVDLTTGAISSTNHDGYKEYPEQQKYYPTRYYTDKAFDGNDGYIYHFVTPTINNADEVLPGTMRFQKYDTAMTKLVDVQLPPEFLKKQGTFTSESDVETPIRRITPVTQDLDNNLYFFLYPDTSADHYITKMNTSGTKIYSIATTALNGTTEKRQLIGFGNILFATEETFGVIYDSSVNEIETLGSDFDTYHTALYGRQCRMVIRTETKYGITYPVVYMVLNGNGRIYKLYARSDIINGHAIDQTKEQFYDYSVGCQYADANGKYKNMVKGEDYHETVYSDGTYKFTVNKYFIDIAYLLAKHVYHYPTRYLVSNITSLPHILELTIMPGNTYYIYTPEDLLGIGVEITDMLGKFIQMADIDMTGYSFSGIGSDEKPFGGSYDGNGFTISNLTVTTINEDERLYSIGLFNHCNSYIDKMIFKNITIDNVTFTTNVAVYDNIDIGSIVGYSRGDQHYENIKVTTITFEDKFSSIVFGGMAGYIDSWGTYSKKYGDIFIKDITIEKLNFNTTQSAYYAAGLVGQMFTENEFQNTTRGFTIDNVFVTGDILVNSTTLYGAGGIIGELMVYDHWNGLAGCVMKANISKVGFEGNLLGEDNTAGMIGYLYLELNIPESNFTMSDCYSYGKFTEYTNGYLDGNNGGFIGYCSIWIEGSGKPENIVFKNCYTAMEMIVSNSTGNGSFFYLYETSHTSHIFFKNCYFDNELATAHQPLQIVAYNYGTETSISEIYAKKTTEMKTQSTFIDWNFIDIWSMSAVHGYPVFVKALPLIAYTFAIELKALGYRYIE